MTRLQCAGAAGYRKQADGSWKQAWDVVSDFSPPPATATATKS